MKVSEQHLAAAVVTWLESAGHDVYQEVEYRGSVIDIVCVANHEVWAIETKLKWSLELLEQCVERKRLVHRVFAAVPAMRSDHSRLYAELGIGSLVVSLSGRYGFGEGADVSIRHWPKRSSPNHDWPRDLKKKLGPGYKTHAKAGSPNGSGRWTPWLETCERLQYEVWRNPGATLKESIDAITTHYSSVKAARSSLAKWIKLSKVPGVEGRLEDGKLRLYPVESRA